MFYNFVDCSFCHYLGFALLPEHIAKRLLHFVFTPLLGLTVRVHTRRRCFHLIQVSPSKDSSRGSERGEREERWVVGEAKGLQ